LPLHHIGWAQQAGRGAGRRHLARAGRCAALVTLAWLHFKKVRVRVALKGRAGGISRNGVTEIALGQVHRDEGLHEGVLDQGLRLYGSRPAEGAGNRGEQRSGESGDKLPPR